MKDNENEQVQIKKYLHFVMSFTGGFLGAYSLFNFHDLFGNAQTSNLIYIITDVLGHDMTNFVLRIMDFAVYILGFIATVLIPKYTKCNLQLVSIILNCAAGMIICLYPAGVNDYVALCPILFAMAFQWNSFKGVEGFVSSTIFSTNNLRQFVVSLSEYTLNKEPEMMKKAKFFGGTLLFFHFGVAVSYAAYLFFGTKAGWICIVPSFVAVCLLNVLHNWVSFTNFRHHFRVSFNNSYKA